MPEEILKMLIETSVLGTLLYFFLKKYQEQTQKIIDSMMQNTFDLLGVLVEQNKNFCGYLERIDTKISANLWCPYVREVTNGRDKNNE